MAPKAAVHVLLQMQNNDLYVFCINFYSVREDSYSFIKKRQKIRFKTICNHNKQIEIKFKII